MELIPLSNTDFGKKKNRLQNSFYWGMCWQGWISDIMIGTRVVKPKLWFGIRISNPLCILSWKLLLEGVYEETLIHYIIITPACCIIFFFVIDIVFYYFLLYCTIMNESCLQYYVFCISYNYITLHYSLSWVIWSLRYYETGVM